MKEKIVIIGNSIAALSAIKAFRTVDTVTGIHLFGEEHVYPYNRMRLSKGLLSNLEGDKILLQKKEWYTENGVNMSIDKRAISIDTSGKTICFQDGTTADYTKLLVAAGAHNFIPPIQGIDKEGVLTLRNLEDAQRIIKQEQKSQIILNIGGGIQGLETAWILSQTGKKVIITELQSRLMPKQLDQKASDILKKAIENKNIEIMISCEIEELIGQDNKVQGFRMKSGEEIKCDMVLYAIGLEPNVDFIKSSEIKVNKGIIISEEMKTSVEGIYAAGDVAELNGQVYGLWNIAIEQGKIAGYNLAGHLTKYKEIVPVTTLNAFGLSLFSMGTIDEKQADHLIVSDKSDENSYSKILIKSNKVIGSIVIGNTKSSPALKIAIENKINLGEIDYKNVLIDELIEIIKRSK